MKVICDLEANGLNPDRIWVIVCKEIEGGKTHVFTHDKLGEFATFAGSVSTWVGHNFLHYDMGVINRLVPGVRIDYRSVVDTLVVSRTTNSLLDGHSLEDWGERLKCKKIHTDIEKWDEFDERMIERCVQDVEVTYHLYNHLSRFLFSEIWKSPLETEHFTSYICIQLNSNGFTFDLKEAKELKKRIDKELESIDKELKNSFLPKVTLVREVTPRVTKHGTIAKNSIPKVLGNDLSSFIPNAPFSLIKYEPFNPGSPKQIVERLNEAGWEPTEKTKGHKDTEKAIRELKRKRGYHPSRGAEIASLEARLAEYRVMGWSICEENLQTLPETAPQAAQTLARRLMIANRSSTLQTWLNAYDDKDGRIHGNFNHIGAWTQRMSHDKPNMGNVPKFDAKQPHKTPYSDSMRSLWGVSKDRLLVGVDAESIQLRILGHYINDEQFTFSLVSGNKEDGTDPHSLNQRALGTVCKSRDDAKTFIYAWLLGAGVQKIAAILGCSSEEARRANDNFINFYPGLKFLREKVIPEDAAKGYFQGIDGRYVYIFGDDIDSRRHFTLAGYLQNGETIVMKRAMQIWYPQLEKEGVPFKFVNFVHDEWQTETIADMDVARYIAEVQADSIRQVGVDLSLNCPMAGSILNAHGKLAIGNNWMETH